jgi:ACS family tartrate transporter-like MFS transporter
MRRWNPDLLHATEARTSVMPIEYPVLSQGKPFMTNVSRGRHQTRSDRFLAAVWRTPTDDPGERARRRVTLHLIPYLFFLYILAYLDRVNVSVAGLRMELPPEQGGLGFTKEIIGFGAGIFFWGYWILEVPSTLSVLRWGARWVFVRILVLWGLSCVLIGTIGTPTSNALFAWLPAIPADAGFVAALDGTVNVLFGWLARLLQHDQPLAWFHSLAVFYNGLPDQPVNQFYFYRFMLGFFEGGFFPSVILYLSLWFRASHRAKAVASFMAAVPVASVFGMPISGLLLDLNWLGWPGWRWIFILQGVVPMVAGVVTLFVLPDRPQHAKWLLPEERDSLLQELAAEAQSKAQHLSLRVLFSHLGVVLLLTVVYFCLNVISYGLGMFMPAIIKSQSGTRDFWASALASLPYLMALLGMFINGWHSDRSGERVVHVAVPLACLGIGISVAAAVDGLGIWPVVAMVFLVGPVLYAHLPAFWPIPTMFLGAASAASAIGFINMIGNLGGFVGPYVVGRSATDTASFADALFKLAPFPIVAAAVVLLVALYRRRSH